VYRFLPLRLTARDLERVHGADERVAIRDYYTGIRLSRQLLVDAAVMMRPTTSARGRTVVS
jgi:acetylornithine deacetylase/succinyl-diaminopimelate desuccinylase-like protein